MPNLRYKLDTPVGTYYVDLWLGLIHDRVKIWQDVRPALGGMIAQYECRHGKGRGERLHEAMVKAVNRSCEKVGWEITLDHLS